MPNLFHGPLPPRESYLASRPTDRLALTVYLSAQLEKGERRGEERNTGAR